MNIARAPTFDSLVYYSFIDRVPECWVHPPKRNHLPNRSLLREKREKVWAKSRTVTFKFYAQQKSVHKSWIISRLVKCNFDGAGAARSVWRTQIMSKSLLNIYSDKRLNATREYLIGKVFRWKRGDAFNVDYSDASSILWLIPSDERKQNCRKNLNILWSWLN